MGVMAGRALDRAFFGSGGAPAADAIEGDGSPDQGYYGMQEQDAQIEQGVCAREVLEFQKCLERTGTNMDACKWNMDLLTACQRQFEDGNQGFASAGSF